MGRFILPSDTTKWFWKADKVDLLNHERLVTIDENYRVITLIFKKYGNLPLCMENYALFSLPPIFTNILYTYPLRYITYLEEPSGNTISNYHGKFIHIYMHLYDPMFKKNIWKSYLPRLILPVFCPLLFSCQQYIKNSSNFYKLGFFISLNQ